MRWEDEAVEVVALPVEKSPHAKVALPGVPAGQVVHEIEPRADGELALHLYVGGCRQGLTPPSPNPSFCFACTQLADDMTMRRYLPG